MKLRSVFGGVLAGLLCIGVLVVGQPDSGVSYPPLLVRDEGVSQGRVNLAIDCVGTGLTCSVASGVATLNSTAGGGAPTDAEYWVNVAHASLSAEKVLGTAVGTIEGLCIGIAGCTPTADQVQVGDGAFKLHWVSATETRLEFDGGDYFGYDRTGNALGLTLSSISRLSVNASGLQIPDGLVVGSSGTPAAGHVYVGPDTAFTSSDGFPYSRLQLGGTTPYGLLNLRNGSAVHGATMGVVSFVASAQTAGDNRVAFIHGWRTGTSTTALDGMLDFYTTGAGALAQAMRVDNSQRLLGIDGTTGRPFYSFLNDPDTGMYRDAANAIGFAASGGLALRVTVDGVRTLGGVSVGNTLVDATSGMLLLLGKAFADLGVPSNGSVAYCSDCTFANPCASGGTGAIAKRLNGAWRCD